MPKNKGNDKSEADSVTGSLARAILRKLRGGFPREVKSRRGTLVSSGGGVYAGRMGRAFSRVIEESTLFRAFSHFVDSILKLRLRVYGVFFLTFGLYTAVIELVLAALLEGEHSDIFQIFCGVCLAVASLPLLYSNVTLSHALRHSDFGKWLISVFGIRAEAVNRRGADGRCGGAFLAGAAAGILSYFISPVSIMLIVVKLIFLWAVFNSPEAALPALLLVYPFISVKTAVLMALSGVLSFALKLLRGKRFVSFTSSDGAVLLLGVIILASSAAMGADIFFAGMYCIAAMCGYFLPVILLKSRQWIYTAVSAYLTSVTAVASCIILQTSLGALRVGGDILSFVSAEDSVLRTGVSSLSPCFAMALPLAVGMLCDPQENVRRRTALVSAVTSVAVLLVCDRAEVAFAAILGSVAVLVVRNKKNIYAVVSAALIYIAVSLWMPGTIKSLATVADRITNKLISFGLPLSGEESGASLLLSDTLIKSVFPFGEILIAGVMVAVLAQAASFSVSCCSVPSRSLSFGEISGGERELDDGDRYKVLTSLRLGAVCSAVGAASYAIIAGGSPVWDGGVTSFIMWVVLGLSPAFVSSVADEISLGSSGMIERNDAIAASVELIRSPVGGTVERTVANGKKKI